MTVTRGSSFAAASIALSVSRCRSAAVDLDTPEDLLELEQRVMQRYRPLSCVHIAQQGPNSD